MGGSGTVPSSTESKQNVRFFSRGRSRSMAQSAARRWPQSSFKAPSRAEARSSVFGNRVRSREIGERIERPQRALAHEALRLAARGDIDLSGFRMLERHGFTSFYIAVCTRF